MPAQTIEGFALSLQQRRYWSFLSSAPESELVSRAEYRIRGKLDTAAFEQALRHVIERHEILRSAFKSVPGLPESVQVVEEEFQLRAPKAEKAQGSSRRVQHAPLLDWHLESRSTEEHRLRISLPAISADYKTLRLLLKELATEYECVDSGGEREGEPMQYLDYAQWQADLQSSAEASAGLQHWGHLEEAAEVRSILLEGSGTGFKCEHEFKPINREHWEKAEAVARAHGTEIESILAAAWTAFCGRLQDGESEVVVGIETSGRNFEELEDALGPYDCYLPVRVRFDARQTPAQLIGELRLAHSTARQHQDFYGPRRNPGRELGWLFAYHKAARALTHDGLHFEFVRGESHSEPFKLKLEVIGGDGECGFALYYNAERFSGEYARVLADRFAEFLADFVTRWESPLGTIRNVSATEVELTTSRFARTGPAEAKEPTVLACFRKEVQAHPQRPALIYDGKVLTFAQLNERANQLANLLLKLGVTPGSPVAISAERSFEMIVGLLGIQKAGGAYVPLDPGYPKDRLQFVLEDCGAQVLVAQPALLSKLPAHKGKTVELSEDNPQLRAEPATEPNAAVRGETLAYIIYTSGSTGQPKGVPITHRNLACSTAARMKYYHQPLANYLLLSSFAFDSSIAGIFWSLSQGATLTIPREGTQSDPRELAGLIREYKVSHLLALPSFYQAILQHSTLRDLNSVTTVIVAGEACTPELVERHYKRLPGAELFNEYGPTEGTVWATVHHCERDVRESTVPIGRPVPNMSVFILNEAKQPAGIGQLGEIYIGGPTLANGYLNRPDLTSEKFVTNPLATKIDANTPGVLYRTGDLGCFRPDGTIEFHGRIDEQVKIRGYRIEIGEIENVLARHPDVRESVVLAREDTPGEKRLVAYLVPEDQARFSIPELRMFAQEKLPQFMVPAQFVVLKSLPSTPNGKVDRKALPAPEELDRNERTLLAPRNADEETLARIWVEVLKLEKVGMEENFFDLGGHSLLAIQVIARVRDAFQVELPMASFFESPTIEGMAAALSRCRKSKRSMPGEIRRATRVQANEDLLAKLQSGSGK